MSLANAGGGVNPRCDGTVTTLTALQGFQFIERARPIGTKQTRKTSIREDFAAGLTAGTVIGFVIGVADPLHLLSAARTRKTEAPMHRHLPPERRNFFREGFSCFSHQSVYP